MYRLQQVNMFNIVNDFEVNYSTRWVRYDGQMVNKIMNTKRVTY